jgi:Rod binding domain-containing protein
MGDLVTVWLEHSGNIVTDSLPAPNNAVRTAIGQEDEMDSVQMVHVAGTTRDRDDSAGLRKTAVKLEAQFLSEMLKHAGLDGPASEFSGGSGEDQFGSFLRDAQAMRMAQAGGIGLAETIFRALQARAS